MNNKANKKKVSEAQFRNSSDAIKKNKNNISQTSDNALNKKNTSLRLDKQTLKALKIRAIEQETSIQNLIESLILAYLK